MNSDTQEINDLLKSLRDGIRMMQPGPDRERLQSRFDRMLDRIEQVPHRVMAEFDKRGLKRGGPELAAVWRVEMESALAIWGQDS
jgi:hypothetical protein